MDSNPKMIVDAIYNAEKAQFEVWVTNETMGFKTLMLIQTQEDILRQMKTMIVQQLQNLAQIPASTLIVPVGTDEIQDK